MTKTLQDLAIHIESEMNRLNQEAERMADALDIVNKYISDEAERNQRLLDGLPGSQPKRHAFSDRVVGFDPEPIKHVNEVDDLDAAHEARQTGAWLESKIMPLFRQGNEHTSDDVARAVFGDDASKQERQRIHAALHRLKKSGILVRDGGTALYARSR